MARHLIRKFDHQYVPALAVITCTGSREDYDRRRHTVLDSATTCPQCRAAAATPLIEPEEEEIG